jgi:flagellin-like hook-associated protein FlgL
MNSSSDERMVKGALSALREARAKMDLIGRKLERMRHLAKKASSPDSSLDERERIQMEVDRLIKEIDELTR